MRKKTNFNPELLKEELNRFKLLNEYSFYNGKNEDVSVHGYDDKDIILGDLSEEDENQKPDDAADDIANELGIEEPTNNATAPDDMGGDDMVFDAEPTDNAPEAEPAPETEPAMEEPTSDDIEVDVTELVKGSEEAKMAADKASQNSELLMQKLSDLESRISSMDVVSNKIAELEQEIVKRNPTPIEKLEMQSLHSGPYTQKLSDYWATKHGAYDVMGNDEKEDEYILTQKDVDDSYSEADTKQSFSVKDEDYEEEEY